MEIMAVAYVDWNPLYSVNNALLDEQHQQMFAIISDLHSAMFNKNSQQQMIAAIRQLVEYTQKHFAEEERQMERSGFPGLAGHKAAHEKLKQQVIEIERRIHDAKDSMAGEMIGFLVSDWLVKHIIEMDKKYAPYLKKAD
ncbi:MAG: bacteriohemerythrin [Betaproteobacteria bacterium]